MDCWPTLLGGWLLYMATNWDAMIVTNAIMSFAYVGMAIQYALAHRDSASRWPILATGMIIGFMGIVYVSEILGYVNEIDGRLLLRPTVTFLSATLIALLLTKR